jgi:undecaprenyl-diphosphatase
MTLFHAIVLGLVQGLGEFLPISSSAHLILVPWAFGWPDPGLSFDVALHVGTLAAVAWYFRREWVRLARAAVTLASSGGGGRARTADERLVIFLVIATIPGAIGGKLLEHAAEAAFRAPLLIAATLIVMGVVLWAVDRAAPASRPSASAGWRDALALGVAQVLALIPGVSRSGATITAGRALGFDRDSAAVLSFLMSGPIILGAAIVKVPHLLEAGVTVPLVAALVASALSGWVAIAVLLRYVKSHSFGAFAAYRLVLGAAVIGLVVVRTARLHG